MKKQNKKQVYQDYLNYDQDTEHLENLIDPFDAEDTRAYSPEEMTYLNRMDQQRNEHSYEELEYNEFNRMQRRAKYHPKIDHFLNNGIIITGVLLILVLVIAFLI